MGRGGWSGRRGRGWRGKVEDEKGRAAGAIGRDVNVIKYHRLGGWSGRCFATVVEVMFPEAVLSFKQ